MYARLPITAQHWAVSAFGVYWHWLRFGPGYKASLLGYRKREPFTQSEWITWQTEKLRRTLRTAAESVPYYRKHWSSLQKTAAIEGRLSELPLLGKEPLRANFLEFVRDDRAVKSHVFHTSGSTGTPVASVWTVQEIRNSLALREARSANWAKVSFSQPRATFSGRMVEPDPNSKGPYYRFNAVEKQVYLSAFHLRPQTAKDYIYALSRHKIEWLTGYAVSYYLLAKSIIEQQLEPPPLKAIITTSEKVTPEMRTVTETAFGCRVYEEYSTVENAVFASECESGKLHVSPDACVVEILRPDGTSCAPGEVGEVVATCLMRDHQPLVRYRLGDLAAWDSEPCSCGRDMPVIKEVVGRLEDVVVGPDGRQMVRFHGVFVGQPNIVEGQIVQESITAIRAKVVGTSQFGVGDVQDIKDRIRQRLGPSVDVTVERVDVIPRTKAGKFKAVISLIQPQRN